MVAADLVELTLWEARLVFELHLDHCSDAFGLLGADLRHKTDAPHKSQGARWRAVQQARAAVRVGTERCRYLDLRRRFGVDGALRGGCARLARHHLVALAHHGDELGGYVSSQCCRLSLKMVDRCDCVGQKRPTRLADLSQRNEWWRGCMRSNDSRSHAPAHTSDQPSDCGSPTPLGSPIL